MYSHCPKSKLQTTNHNTVSARRPSVLQPLLRRSVRTKRIRSRRRRVAHFSRWDHRGQGGQRRASLSRHRGQSIGQFSCNKQHIYLEFWKNSEFSALSAPLRGISSKWSDTKQLRDLSITTPESANIYFTYTYVELSTCQ